VPLSAAPVKPSAAPIANNPAGGRALPLIRRVGRETWSFVIGPSSVIVRVSATALVVNVAAARGPAITPPGVIAALRRGVILAATNGRCTANGRESRNGAKDDREGFLGAGDRRLRRHLDDGDRDIPGGGRIGRPVE
jgi:hypothetical protein